jgi:hypothetical protein
MYGCCFAAASESLSEASLLLALALALLLLFVLALGLDFERALDFLLTCSVALESAASAAFGLERLRRLGAAAVPDADAAAAEAEAVVSADTFDRFALGDFELDLDAAGAAPPLCAAALGLEALRLRAGAFVP